MNNSVYYDAKRMFEEANAKCDISFKSVALFFDKNLESLKNARELFYISASKFKQLNILDDAIKSYQKVIECSIDLKSITYVKDSFTNLIECTLAIGINDNIDFYNYITKLLYPFENNIFCIPIYWQLGELFCNVDKYKTIECYRKSLDKIDFYRGENYMNTDIFNKKIKYIHLLIDTSNFKEASENLKYLLDTTINSYKYYCSSNTLTDLCFLSILLLLVIDKTETEECELIRITYMEKIFGFAVNEKYELLITIIDCIALKKHNIIENIIIQNNLNSFERKCLIEIKNNIEKH